MNDLILEVHVRGKSMPTIKWFLDRLIIKEDTGKYLSLRCPDGLFQLSIYDHKPRTVVVTALKRKM
jgi:hypothetical protein